MLEKHKVVFGDIPPAISHNHGFEHVIELEEGAKPVIMTPYCHPRHYMEKIERTIRELLDIGHIDRAQAHFLHPWYWSRRRMEPQRCVWAIVY